MAASTAARNLNCINQIISVNKSAARARVFDEISIDLEYYTRLCEVLVPDGFCLKIDNSLSHTRASCMPNDLARRVLSAMSISSTSSPGVYGGHGGLFLSSALQTMPIGKQRPFDNCISYLDG